MAILLPQQDWVEQSCCHSRIGWSNPVPTPGLTAGRVSGEKTLCQRCCEDSIADRPPALARQWFSG